MCQPWSPIIGPAVNPPAPEKLFKALIKASQLDISYNLLVQLISQISEKTALNVEQDVQTYARFNR